MSRVAGSWGTDRANLDRRLAIGALIVALLAPRAIVDSRRTICPFRRVTGLPCPTCGLTRSVHAAGRFRIRQSVAAHPLGIAALGAGVLVATGRWQPSRPDPRPSPALLAGAAVWIATWLVRLQLATGARRS